jgi:hypothetical protein
MNSKVERLTVDLSPRASRETQYPPSGINTPKLLMRTNAMMSPGESSTSLQER